METTSMRRSFAATNLNAEAIDSAYALIQALHPRLTLEAWRVFAKPLVNDAVSSRGGIVGIRNETGYLCGLFVYRVEADLEYERAFIIDPIAALDVIDSKATMQAMVAAAESTASRLDCHMTRIRVSRDQTALLDYLRNSGHRVDGQLLSRPLDVSSPLV